MTRRRGAGLLSFVLVVSACTAGQGAPSTSISPATTAAVSTDVTVAESACPDTFCVVYRIRPEAIWSDGAPVTAGDFAFTYEKTMEKGGPAPGYELITAVTILDQATLLVAFSKAFPAWRTLFPVVLPAHSRDGIQVASGPFILGDITDEAVTLRRNPVYWADKDPVSGEALGDVRTLRFVAPGGLRSSLGALRRGEVHLVVPDPVDWAVAELRAMEGVSLRMVPGPVWEHIDFNQTDPLLSQPWVREAFARAIDREAILDATVRNLDPEAPLLGNTVWMTNSARYEDHYATPYDPALAEQLLSDNGCVRGEDGVFVCDDIPMSFVWAAADGDRVRRTVFELVARQLAEVGIEIIPDFRVPSELYASEFLFGGSEDWQLVNFAWRASADPYAGNTLYLCSGELNVTRYCNEEVDNLIATTDRTLDPAERATLYNQADALYLADLAVIPLFQRPVALAWSSELAGPEPNISRSTHLWNVATWTGLDEVVIGLDAVPTAIDPLSPTSLGEALVVAALYQGAFAVDPSFGFVPVLVESTETILGGS